MKKKVFLRLFMAMMVFFMISISGQFEVGAEAQEVTVSSEMELRRSVHQSQNVPTAILLAADIVLESNFVISRGMDITLRNVDGEQFSLIAALYAPAITIESGAILTIDGIEVTHRSSTNRSAGIDNRGTFVMDSGIITGFGGGGLINRGGQFTMNGGVITRNFSHAGGGGVRNEGTFIMNGGLISNNSASTNLVERGARLARLNDGREVLTSGIRQGINDISSGGGGVLNHSSFTMNGGVIYNNVAQVGGGVNNVGARSQFIMNGGSINDNTARGLGGGVNVDSERGASVFTMNGGIISSNWGVPGGGIAVDGRFIMYDGLITENMQDGIFLRGRGWPNDANSFTIYGGWIFNNYAWPDFPHDERSLDNARDFAHGAGNFFNNIFDSSLGAIGSPPPNFVYIPVEIVAPAANFTQPPIIAVPTVWTAIVNGRSFNLQGFRVYGSHNGFSLRDIAYILNGTSAQFSVEWDVQTNTIVLTSGEPYTPVGNELSRLDDNTPLIARIQPLSLLINGQQVNVSAFNVNNTNYLTSMLGNWLGFSVRTDSATSTTIYITTP